MKCCNGKSYWPWALLALAFAALVAWYVSLPEYRKRFYANLARQAPELPGRYMV